MDLVWRPTASWMRPGSLAGYAGSLPTFPELSLLHSLTFPGFVSEREHFLLPRSACWVLLKHLI